MPNRGRQTVRLIMKFSRTQIMLRLRWSTLTLLGTRLNDTSQVERKEVKEFLGLI